MTELQVKQAIVLAINECKHLGQPIREQIESVIGVDKLATVIARSLTKQGFIEANPPPAGHPQITHPWMTR
jgi:hypothetical protein